MARKKTGTGAFPVALQEFLREVTMPESARAFGLAMKGEGKKPPEEWRKLFAAWLRKPVGVPWETWRRTC